MKAMFGAAVVVSFVALAACSSGGSSSSGDDGDGGDDWGSTTTMVTSTSTSTGTGGGMATSSSSSGSGTGGAGGGASACDNTGTCQTCNSCAQKAGGPCYDKAVALQMLPNFMVYYQCITPCAAKPPPEQKACIEPCCTANMAECQAYGEFAQCTVCDACPNDCSAAGAMCPP